MIYVQKSKTQKSKDFSKKFNIFYNSSFIQPYNKDIIKIIDILIFMNNLVL